MKIQDVLKKVAAKETLTDEELKFLEEYDPDETNRIPVDRLNKEIEKRKAAEQKADELNSKIEELNASIEELKTKDLDEAAKAKLASEKELAKLRKQVDDLTKSSNEAKEKAQQLERSNQVRELASARKFKDVDYLDFKLKSQGLDLSDADSVGKFFDELEKTSPHLFESGAKPGTGTGGTNQDGKGGNSVNLVRLEELRAKPEFTRAEAQEFIKLSNEQKAAEDAANANK